MQRFFEIEFWKGLVKSEGDNYLNRRKGDFERHCGQYGGECYLDGSGVEFGTGCYSMLEFSNADRVVGVDPLADEYKKISPEPNKKVTIENIDGENTGLESEGYDWSVCWNVIDHTPNPSKMVSEMFRVVKPGGRIYLQVNFDDELSPAHYGIWNTEMVKKYFGDKKMVYEKTTRNEADKQTWYYAIYVKE